MPEPASPPAPPAASTPPAPARPAATGAAASTKLPPGAGEIDRGATGIRIVLTLLFAIIARVVELLLTVLVLFELGFALVTQHPPSRKIRDFANQVCTYLYRVTRYLTYNEAEPPFPFTDFPESLEAPTDDYDEPLDSPA